MHPASSLVGVGGVGAETVSRLGKFRAACLLSTSPLAASTFQQSTSLGRRP